MAGEPDAWKPACPVRREIPRKPNMETYKGAGILPYMFIIQKNIKTLLI
jgi:hypothetical protein